MKHKKKFAIVLSRNEPKARIYLNNEKMTTDIARSVLDAYKAKGYRYFKFPPFNTEEGFGKDGQVAFIKASVKTGMVILLKGADGQGCSIGPADLKTILNEVKEEENFVRNHDQKIEYLMRWHEQIEKFMRNNPKEVKQLNDYADKFKQQANFEYFSSSYKDLIDDQIVQGINGTGIDGKEPWDNVDVIASQYAVTKILTEMRDGYIGNKRFNPLDKEGNAKLVLDAFDKYRKAERPKIEEEIKSNITELSENDDARDKVKQAIDRVQSRYDHEHKVICDDLKGNGVDISMRQRRARRGYVPEKRRTTNPNHPPKRSSSGRTGI